MDQEPIIVGEEKAIEPSPNDMAETSMRPPKRNRNNLYLAITFMVIALLLVSSIYLISTSSEKGIKSTAFDVLLNQNDMPVGWSIDGSPLSENITQQMPVNGQNGVHSIGESRWFSGTTVEPSNVSINEMVFVFDNANDAHSAIMNWITPGSQYTPVGYTVGAGKLLNGTIGDESYGNAMISSDSCTSAVIFREANTVTGLWIDYPSHGWEKDPYYESLLSTIAQKQCDKIRISS